MVDYRKHLTRLLQQRRQTHFLKHIQIVIAGSPVGTQ
jgi:hypothetical protein